MMNVILYILWAANLMDICMRNINDRKLNKRTQKMKQYDLLLIELLYELLIGVGPIYFQYKL